jgi:hypothetical protein
MPRGSHCWLGIGVILGTFTPLERAVIAPPFEPSLPRDWLLADSENLPQAANDTVTVKRRQDRRAQFDER